MSRRLALNSRDLLDLQPEELGGLILEALNKEVGPFFELPGLIACLWAPSMPTKEHYAIAEAITWLESNVLLARLPNPNATQQEVLFITRQGKALKSHQDVARFVESRTLPEVLLHPAIAERARSAFLRGEYDVAVFTAFKAVEVAVRDAAGFPATAIGVPLMRTAFHEENGPLRKPGDPVAERQATRELFFGCNRLLQEPSQPPERSSEAGGGLPAIDLRQLASPAGRCTSRRSPYGAGW